MPTHPDLAVHAAGLTGVPAQRSAQGALHAAQPAGSPLASTRSTVHREPVITMDGRVVGYAVSVTVESAAGTVPAELLHAQYMSLDLPNLVADRYVFLPATPAMLDGFVPQPVVPGRLVLDLPPGYELAPDAVPRAAALRALGVQLTLTGYTGHPAQEALLPHASFVQVDPSNPHLPLAAVVHHLHGQDCRVLAVDVTSHLVADECRAAGVDGLRGGFADPGTPSQQTASAPEEPVASRVLRAGELQCLALMHLLTSPDVDLESISQVVDTDPVLTLRVLHLVNSGAFALVNEVDTVHQAVVLLGVRELTTLVAALLVDARPDAMDSLWFILARALTCEELADDLAAYTVGMLSALATQLGVPAEAILEKVGVSSVVADAVRAEEGPLGPVLAAVRAHERNDSGAVLAAGLLPAEVSSAYVRCLANALDTARTVTRGPGF